MSPSKRDSSVSLKSAIDEGTAVLERVSRASKRLSLEGTATLVGSFSGLLGIALSYGVAITIPAVSLGLAAPLGLGIGITGGLLLFRGSSAAKLDREMDDRRRAAAYLLEQIKTLPRSAPEGMKAKLWIKYEQVVVGNAPLEYKSSVIEHEQVLLPRSEHRQSDGGLAE